MPRSLLSDKIARIARFAGIGAGMLLLGSAALVTVEVISRRVFHHSMVGVDEVSGYAFAVAMAWGFSYAFFERAHIRVDILYLRLPAPVQRVLDVIALGAFAGILAIVIYKACGTLAETLRIGARASTPLGTPLWIPQSLWLCGLIFFLISLIARLFDLVRAVARRDGQEAKRLGGPESLFRK